MTEDKFFERLRHAAQSLQYRPAADDPLWTRLVARIDDRVRRQPAIATLLASWFRPIAAALGVVSLAAILSIPWMDTMQEPSTVEAMVSASAPAVDLAIEGETSGVE